MAEIRPFRAWRYTEEYYKEIDQLTSPLFDVVSEKQRKALYQNPFNSIHLSVPSEEDKAKGAEETLSQWKQQGVVEQDPLPGIYVYYQHFNLPGTSKMYCRKGFIAFIRAYDWEDQVLLRHENTIPKAVNDRIEILKSTQLNVSPTHGLYSDPEYELESYMDESMQNPIYETEDYQGVRDVLSVIQDVRIIHRFLEVMKEKQVILADGHHRYEGSLAYKKEMIQQNPKHNGEEGYNFHLMFFTNMEADGLRILPTHRLVKNLNGLSEDAFLQKASDYFYIKNVDNPQDINEIILGKKWAFGAVFRDNAYKLRLKEDVHAQLEWKFPEEVLELDLTVMHYFILEKIIGIKGKEQRASENLIFDRNFADCLAKVFKSEVSLALITREIDIEEVKKVCFSGYTLPQKSTYFYPKVICGFLFGSIRDNEFKIPLDFRV